jgi:hypothetical protein
MPHDESKINDKGAWVVYRLRAAFKWLWITAPHLREDLISEFDLSRLLAEMYDHALKAYNESRRRIHALAVNEGYHYNGSGWDGSRRGTLSNLQSHIVYGTSINKRNKL